MNEKEFMFLFRNIIRLVMTLCLLYLLYSLIYPGVEKSVAFISQLGSIIFSIPVFIALFVMREKHFKNKKE